MRITTIEPCATECKEKGKSAEDWNRICGNCPSKLRTEIIEV